MYILVAAIGSMLAAVVLAATLPRLTVALVGACLFFAAFMWNLKVEDYEPPSLAFFFAAVWVMLPWTVGLSIGRGISAERQRS